MQAVTVRSADPPGGRRINDHRLWDFARAWAQAMAGTSYVSMTHAEIEEFLFGLANHLATIVRGEPRRAAMSGYEVGTALVATGFDSPEGLGQSVAVVHDRLLTDLGLTGDGPRQRVSRLLETMTAGYTRALRDRTLSEQEEIRRAALLAREQAEQALRSSEARYRHDAMHDPLTGLPNRALFTQRLADLFTQATPDTRLGLCFVDLDGFKAVNDSFGHHVGDQLLMAVAERLAGIADEFECLVARLGGDEFVILIPDTTCADDAVKVADRALTVLREPIRIEGHRLRVSASIGVVEQPAAGTDMADLMRAADITLYWAKASGRARWAMFDPTRNAREVARYKLAAAMPAALERDEFVLDYQPLIDLASGATAGMEALARWHHPTRGKLTADHFIDLAEDTGLIVVLGRRLLELACQQARGWYKLTPTPPFVSVNLSVRQIHHPDLVGDVAAILNRSGLPPSQLQLEITESVAMGTEEEAMRTLRALADLGVRLVIDDFGTGYSNLAYLRALPVGGLKLAGMFIHGLHRSAPPDHVDETILTTLVTLGHALGLTITAEGIETADHAQRLRAIGCDLGQGWHFSRPQPDHRLTPWITRDQPTTIATPSRRDRCP